MSSPGQPGGTPDSTPKVISGSDQAANEAVRPADRTPSGGQAPPAPVTPPDPRSADHDLSTKAADLERQLAEVRAQAAGDTTVRVKVESPHSGFTHNGLYVGEDFTAVPAHAVPAMMEAASDSGVTLTQEEV